MKAPLCIFIFIYILMTNCVRQGKNPLEGTWKMISGYSVSKDTIEKFPGNHMKNIGRNYFSTIWQDTALKNSDWTGGFNGGTYTFKDGIYSEQFEYFSMTGYIGQKAAMRAEIRNDTLFISPYSDKANDEKYGFFEKWKRLE